MYKLAVEIIRICINDIILYFASSFQNFAHIEYAMTPVKHFHTAIEAILKNWTALQLAVQHVRFIFFIEEKIKLTQIRLASGRPTEQREG